MTDAVPAHLDLDALADALAGEGDHGGSTHLAGCASCTSRLAELEAAEAGVVAALRALPDPALPDGLAERLNAALRGEPGLAAPSSTRSSTVTALPERPARRSWLPAAAAAVLLVAGGGLGYALLSGGSGGGADETASSTAAAGDAGADLDLPLSSSGTDYADTAAVSGVLPAVLAGSAGPVVLMDSQTGATVAAPEQDARTSTPAPAAAAGEDPLVRLRTPQGLADCLAAVLPAEEPDLRPRALDYASYQGQPALAVLLPDPDPAKVSVYVVGPDCAAADARLLGFFRVDAP